MSAKGKQLSTPFSTGGGGPNFENQVQTAFVVLMLTGGAAPCLPPWPIKKIKLQGKCAGYNTDDFIAIVEDQNSGQKAKLLAQIALSITENDAPFRGIACCALYSAGLLALHIRLSQGRTHRHHRSLQHRKCELEGFKYSPAYSASL